ncbi:conjugal transfer protein TraA [Acidovorax sp. CCYZU-2555]|jgi:hypothetical protein|uniref:conjugal transfer protein TraA n=1 Tax=Acidovorax sp. CCYZU-2555 TaxID=2835042 RepID=UPI001BCCECA2|nr:conjugal transfer protein TraA [Acidovorax sp. CCYZU-2555]MBS7776853.1 conjugal transfer protein TraA [Acidovorax sp. CCYZU-2555]
MKSGGSSIPVWYVEEDRRRVEEACALAGYRHLSKYIRDKSLGRDAREEPHRDRLQTWADHQDLVHRLGEIERAQRQAHALLAMLLFLLQKRATAAETRELLLACESARTQSDILAASVPELASILTRFTQDC